MSAPTPQQCGFGPGATVAEADLREAVRLAATGERANWFGPGGAIDEQEDTQFGYLVRYWLASKGDILPTTLTFAQAKAIDSSTAYGPLLTSPSVSNAQIASVRDALLLGAPDVGSPPNLHALVDDALRSAHQSGQGNPDFPWSAVFVVSCIRAAAIALGLEGVSGGVHAGRDELLLANEGHRFYVQQAYQRRFGPGLKDGTYHARCPAPASCAAHDSCPDEHPVHVGDIIVQDRTLPLDDIELVDDFCEIPDDEFLEPNPLHGDIVVEVASSWVEAIGGNLQSGDDASTPLVFAVRRRRFPLNPDGTLAVAQAKLFTQEDDTGNVPDFPPDDPDSDVNSKSTGRIFALLSPVELCISPAPGE